MSVDVDSSVANRFFGHTGLHEVIVAVSYHFKKHDINNLYHVEHDERLIWPAVGHAILEFV